MGPPKTPRKLAIPTWRTPEGETVSCIEKIKVLNENLEEIQTMAQEALEDAVLMGADEAQFRAVLRDLAEGLVNPYKKT
ncbi:MAG TPA: hypothetical protein VLX09_23480 [Stellaceae bacterium]|nr:hypothetical protein [Stellaceae bacterium]